MPRAIKYTGVFIRAEPTIVFEYISDLARHTEWSVQPINVEVLSPGPIAVGSHYRFSSRFMGRSVSGEQRIVLYEPPNRFAYIVSDSAGEYLHEFKLSSFNMGTLLERQITAQWSFPAWLMATFLWWRAIGKPRIEKSYQLLKSRLEEASPSLQHSPR